MQSDPQQKSYRWDETLITTPTNIWAILLAMCRPLPPNHLIPTKKPLLLCSSGRMLCLCIHWLVQNTEQHPFLIHAGSVYTICVLFLFSYATSSVGHSLQLGHFESNCLSSHGWRWTLAFWPLSWPVTSSVFDLKYLGQTWSVVWSMSLRIADRREFCTHLSILVSYTGWQANLTCKLVAKAL
jgi:hypothetical protein